MCSRFQVDRYLTAVIILYNMIAGSGPKLVLGRIIETLEWILLLGLGDFVIAPKCTLSRVHIGIDRWIELCQLCTTFVHHHHFFAPSATELITHRLDTVTPFLL